MIDERIHEPVTEGCCLAAQEQPPRRSAGSLAGRRAPLPWPEGCEFHILAIDGGGIRGIFPAAVLSELEARDPGAPSVACRFDLIAGTSTGGIIAIGLGAGLTAAQIRDMYADEGGTIFPSRWRSPASGCAFPRATARTEISGCSRRRTTPTTRWTAKRKWSPPHSPRRPLRPSSARPRTGATTCSTEGCGRTTPSWSG